MEDVKDLPMRAQIALKFVPHVLDVRFKLVAMVPWYRRVAAAKRVSDSGQLSEAAIVKDAFKLADEVLKQAHQSADR